ncbi:uncharacterized protein LOC143559548 [Bidens hawaiensis]|uniref:uncharacterized protein LOC143559548 n=1 Tax=Bidens hawaiensis TaxID=980011 RepID=UPI00404980CE
MGVLMYKVQSSLPDLQRCVGDIARRLDERPPGQFSGTSKPNPSAHLKEITTRSGRLLGPMVSRNRVEVEDEEAVDEKIEMEVPSKIHGNTPVFEPQVESSIKKKAVEVHPSHVIDHSHVPYPARLKHQKYTKEKDLLGEVSSIPLKGECSAVVLNRVPKGLSDPGAFTIPCLFGSDMTSQPLADLRASINLMQYSLYEMFELGNLAPTRMSLSLVDRSLKYLRVIIENLLVKFDKFVLPVDFVVLDMEVDERVPIIFGHPFLCTAKALIDVYNRRITLWVGDENVTYDVPRSMKHPGDQDDFSDPCHSVYFLNSFIPGFDTRLDFICRSDLVGVGAGEEMEKEI